MPKFRICDVGVLKCIKIGLISSAEHLVGDVFSEMAAPEVQRFLPNKKFKVEFGCNGSAQKGERRCRDSSRERA